MDGLVEVKRLLGNIVRIGTVADVDHDTARARLRDGALLTAWRPWKELRAGATRTWNPPTIGEQAVLLSATGDPADSIIITGVFSSDHPAPASSPDITRTVYPDGAVTEYDHANHHLQATITGSAALDADTNVAVNAGGTIDATAGGDITAHTPATLTATAESGAVLNADVIINGNLQLNGAFTGAAGYTVTFNSPADFTQTVTNNGVPIDATHTHPGDSGGTTGTPQ